MFETCLAIETLQSEELFFFICYIYLAQILKLWHLKHDKFQPIEPSAIGHSTDETTHQKENWRE